MKISIVSILQRGGPTEKREWVARDMRHCSLTVAQALLNKVDWKIMLMAAISFSALNLDRSNINQANSADFLSDLGLTTDGDHSSTFLDVYGK